MKYVDLTNFGSSLTTMEGLFKGLSSLESVKLPIIPNSKVTSMESMFENCDSLESFDLSKIDITYLTNMNSLF